LFGKTEDRTFVSYFAICMSVRPAKKNMNPCRNVDSTK